MPKPKPYNPASYWPNRFRAHGKTYVARGGRQREYDAELARTRPLLEKHIPRGGKLLDFGCGVGRFAPILAGLCDSYGGVDLVDAALHLAPKLPNAEYTSIRGRLPLPDESIDTVTALYVLQHVVSDQDFDHWTAELGRVLQVGGHAVIVDDRRRSGVRYDAHMNPRGPERVAEAVGVHAFDIMDLGNHWFGVAKK